ncbi:hypothetical protein T08_2343 [Trichinella sp. T8]|nr:hypothetical protein T08_2343 [Trichinella sp. T8]
MDVKAFPSRPSVPLLITNSQRRNSILFMTAMKYSCSDHFVLNVASVSIEFAPDCSCIVQCTLFIHYSITLTSSEYDISSDGALIAADGTLKLRFLRFCFSLSRKEHGACRSGEPGADLRPEGMPWA